MAILTILLVGIFFAAWKAPRWVKEIGAFALAFGFFSLILGLRQMFIYLEAHEDVGFNIIAGGISVALIPVLYGVLIYLVSLVVRMIQKPKL